jgi:hypothetical protein
MEDELQPDKASSGRVAKFLPAFSLGQMLITLPTFAISLALAYATFVQADAARKTQLSETWPYISYSTSNATPEGVQQISFVLENNGVGPARLEQMEFLYKGEAMRNPREFLRKCCAGEAKFAFMSAAVTGVLRPGEKTEFIRLARSDKNATIWDKLNDERWSAIVRSCYCSIFDDCWVADSRQNRPQPVKACPADWTKFEERANEGPRGG